MRRAAIVVVGGAGARLGGVAKPWLQVAGRPIIEHVLEAVRPSVADILVIGAMPASWPVPAHVRTAVEEPRGAGPAAAVRAGMQLLPDEVTEVLLLAGDAPFIKDTVARLLAVELVDDGVAAEQDGHVQFLLARLHRASLQRALDSSGASMHSVFDRLQIQRIASDVVDADTWEDVARLRAGEGRMAEQPWLDEVAGILGVDGAIDVDALLSLTRDVAHNVERKNAPLTAYLIGYAAGARGLSAAQIAEVCEQVAARARERGAHA